MLKQAIPELKALRTEDPARSLALPLLVRLRLEIPTDPAQRTDDDQEFLMQAQDIVDNGTVALITAPQRTAAAELAARCAPLTPSPRGAIRTGGHS